ncbi:hypothetical protein Dda_2226 [Drechslerella dactyloides]|uniref:Uncharacterized protein n=1 Tax=Drechslerella dactyloides TaxID=74499 RepID=A0AAD6J4H8_DREDA|nr:hypothetical protein Dda_2226 [Drechslerella dactyloides]
MQPLILLSLLPLATAYRYLFTGPSFDQPRDFRYHTAPTLPACAFTDVDPSSQITHMWLEPDDITPPPRYTVLYGKTAAALLAGANPFHYLSDPQHNGCADGDAFLIIAWYPDTAGEIQQGVALGDYGNLFTHWKAVDPSTEPSAYIRAAIAQRYPQPGDVLRRDYDSDTWKLESGKVKTYDVDEFPLRVNGDWTPAAPAILREDEYLRDTSRPSGAISLPEYSRGVAVLRRVDPQYRSPLFDERVDLAMGYDAQGWYDGNERPDGYEAGGESWYTYPPTETPDQRPDQSGGINYESSDPTVQRTGAGEIWDIGAGYDYNAYEQPEVTVNTLELSPMGEDDEYSLNFDLSSPRINYNWQAGGTSE